MNPTEFALAQSREWLETDGLGGFASGTATGIRTRRYHALLLTATTPPTGRLVLVNGFDARVETPNGAFSLSSQRYAPDVIGGDGADRIEGFDWEPWPHWIFKLEDGTRIELEIFAAKDRPISCLSWKLLGPRRDARLFVRPFLSGRDYHALHKSNPAFRFEAEVKPDRVSWRPYENVPAVAALINGAYAHDPQWYYNFLYAEERARGLDCVEDLAAPGVLSWNLAEGKAALVLTTEDHAAAALPGSVKPVELLNRLRDAERQRRGKFPSRLHRAADAYIVSKAGRASRLPGERAGASSLESLNHQTHCRQVKFRIRPFTIQGFSERGAGKEGGRDAQRVVARNPGDGPRRASPDNPGSPREAGRTPALLSGKTIIAGYPWFTDWGRDTFIALRGVCLATGRLDVARDILHAWASTVSEGMLPNRFPDQGEEPEFNAVDASLWFVIAVHEYLEAVRVGRGVPASPVKGVSRANGGLRTARPTISVEDGLLLAAVEAILEGYSRGTRFGIRLDRDGLLSCGVPGVQLTWMDAKIGDWVVTPRIGKPVEVQALWLNALKIGSQSNPKWAPHFARGLASFRDRFWNEAGGCLCDVVDCDHQPGSVDAAFRPNQILAAGGLPFSLLDPEQALRVVAAVEARLWVPLGLRSLAPAEPGYTPRYEGGVRERDGAYHQGTVWPWLIGPFVEAWVRVRGETDAAKREARGKFLAPILAHLGDAGLGHISEICDAEPPHNPRGCPFQAWSVGEALRLDRIVLAESITPRAMKPAPKRRSHAVPSVPEPSEAVGALG